MWNKKNEAKKKHVVIEVMGKHATIVECSTLKIPRGIKGGFLEEGDTYLRSF